jgi:hypothetical protein
VHIKFINRIVRSSAYEFGSCKYKEHALLLTKKGKKKEKKKKRKKGGEEEEKKSMHGLRTVKKL